jgi:asparagine synthase (glutamine-hydrolysing)
MPGVVGIIGRIPPARAECELRQMVDALRHENFYVTGMCVEKGLGAYIGWIARKDSFSDGMPVRNERRDVELVFSGEEFPAPGTIQGLKERGHDLGEAAPDYLVHLYEADPSFPAGLNGRFHGLLMDRSRGTALLFNDRYGMHRIYYYESKDAFYFAAEAKAILAVRPECRALDQRGLGEFVACSSVLENRTLFQGIQVLPPASAWEFRNGSVTQKRSYFRPQEWEDQERLDPEAYYQELRHVFTRNLPRYFNGQERIGMSLTGGLDTRMIMACLNADPGSLPCYTFGSVYRENQDVRVARRVALTCNQPFQVITAGQEFLLNFAAYARRTVYLTDGCTDVGLSPILYVNEKASRIAPVRISGVFGGEILRGIRAFKPEMPGNGLFQPELRSAVQQAGETYARVLQAHPVAFAVFKQAPWYHHGILALEQTWLSIRSPYLDNDFVRTVFRASQSTLVKDGVSFRLIADGNPALSKFPTDRGLIENERHVLGAFSRAFLEFLFKAEYAYDSGMPQMVARIDHVFSPFHLERMFLGRHKYYHFRIWYRDALAGYVRDMLFDSRSLSRPYVERKALEKIVSHHLKGDRNYTGEIHKLLTLELIHRLFVDS